MKIIVNFFITLVGVLFLSFFSPCYAAQIAESQGLKLYVPSEVLSLVKVETSKDAENIFRVSELGSVEAAKKLGENDSGAGWIFTISKVPKTKLHETLQRDLSGMELFAYKDGNYYFYNHPTDVRYVRENTEAMKRDQNVWTKVNEWGYSKVRDKFIKDNGLFPITADKARKAAAQSGDDFLGAWHESVAGRGHIEIKKSGEDYKINIRWPESACAASFWQMTAKFEKGALVYEDCEYKSVIFNENGEEKTEPHYKNGKGSFKLLSLCALVWNDVTGKAAEDNVFLRD